MKRELIVTAEGRERSVVIEGDLDSGNVHVTIDGVGKAAQARAIRPGTWSIVVDGRQHLVDLDKRRTGIAASVGASEVVLQVEDVLHRKLAQAAKPRERASGEALRAPIAGKVVKVLVAVGDTVAPHTPVIVLEAMKMENEIVSEHGGTVKAIHKQAAQAVDTGDLLIELA
ncbi:MAG TPA: biotin/lipoyl-containing protein [Kofleriaceae bacterium]|jgi:biotin carboxyl carrier protein